MERLLPENALGGDASVASVAVCAPANCVIPISRVTRHLGETGGAVMSREEARLSIHNVAQISEVSLTFGDLTVLVGAQGTGLSASSSSRPTGQCSSVTAGLRPSGS